MVAKRFALLFAVLTLAALSALAKPNFTGDWKLNTTKSSFGQIPAPDSMTYKITHEEPKLTNASKQSSQMGDFETTSNYSTDGKETTNQGFGGMTTKSTAKWDGDTLLIDTKGDFNGSEISISSKMTLSSDGKTLTVVQKFASAMFEGEQTLVFDKQ